jgi:peptidoglycan L-alanyl-D-glutamate endopeptidase CwlK
MKLSEKQGIFLLNVAKLIQWVNDQDQYVTGGELLRTKEQQQIYVDSWKSKTLDGKHLEKLAIDLNLFINGIYRTDTEAYKPLGQFWVSLHSDNRWGGDWNKDGAIEDEKFKDGNHFEMR